MLRPVCLFLRRLKPISAAFSERRPLDLSEEIQCEVSAKNAAILPFDQTSAVKLIRPQDSYRFKVVEREDRTCKVANSQKGPLSTLQTTSSNDR